MYTICYNCDNSQINFFTVRTIKHSSGACALASQAGILYETVHFLFLCKLLNNKVFNTVVIQEEGQGLQPQTNKQTNKNVGLIPSIAIQL